MTIEVRVPQLPESVADATLVTWHKRPGDAVSRDENLADLETDKVVLEVPAPVAGVLVEVKVEAGSTVTGGVLLAVIDETATAGAAAAKAADAAAPVAAAKAEPKLSPAAKRVVEEQKVDPASVAPVATAASVSAASGPRAGRTEQRVPMSRLRSRIAARLVEAQSTQALLTTFNEVDMSALNTARTRYKDRFEKAHGVRLGFMSFFVKATVEALRRFPIVNAYVDGTDIVYHDYYDIGVAVSTERGLIVPVLRDADLMSCADVERSIGDFAKKGRDGAITIDELTGGTFSITNGGVFGSLMSTPIVNAPQSAILGMHKVQDRPVVVDGQIVIRPMMYLALTYDHRIIDGRDAVQFLVTIKDCLEDPARLLLQI